MQYLVIQQKSFFHLLKISSFSNCKFVSKGQLCLDTCCVGLIRLKIHLYGVLVKLSCNFFNLFFLSEMYVTLGFHKGDQYLTHKHLHTT